MAKVLGFIRIGEKEQAEKVCRDSSQPWRAATLQGWRLSHDSRVFGAEVTDDNGMQVRYQTLPPGRCTFLLTSFSTLPFLWPGTPVFQVLLTMQ